MPTASGIPAPKSAVRDNMMLYLYGDEKQFDDLLQDVPVVSPEILKGTLCEPYTIRFLIAMCERREFDKAKRFADLALMHLPECRPVRLAFLSYIDLKQGHYETAWGSAVATLREPEAYDWAKERSSCLAARLTLAYVAARAALQLDRNLDAIRYARVCLGTYPNHSESLRERMHRDARRILAQAYLKLRWNDGLYDLYVNDPKAAADPYVLNNLSVLLHSSARISEARAVLKQALDLLPKAQGEDELQVVIRKNITLLSK